MMKRVAVARAFPVALTLVTACLSADPFTGPDSGAVSSGTGGAQATTSSGGNQGQTGTGGATTGSGGGSGTGGKLGTGGGPSGGTSGSGGKTGTGGGPTGGVTGSGGGVGTGGRANTGGTGGGSATGGIGSGGKIGTGGTGTGGAATGGAGTGGAGTGGAVAKGVCKDDYWSGYSSGSLTRYDFSQGTSLPACSNVITHKGAGTDGDWDTVEGISTGDGGYFGAMNTADFKVGATCGACVEVTYNGKKLVLTVVDECPISSNSLCKSGHIDISRKAIRALEPDSKKEHLGNGGMGTVSWRYVTCPAIGNVKMRLHSNQNANWQPVVIENGYYPLMSVTLNGKNASRAGNTTGGNAWLVDAGKSPYQVHAVDINGNVLDASYSGTGLMDVGKQFPKCP